MSSAPLAPLPILAFHLAQLHTFLMGDLGFATLDSMDYFDGFLSEIWLDHWPCWPCWSLINPLIIYQIQDRNSTYDSGVAPN